MPTGLILLISAIVYLITVAVFAAILRKYDPGDFTSLPGSLFAIYASPCIAVLYVMVIILDLINPRSD